MSALLVLVLAAADLTPPPAVEAPEESPPAEEFEEEDVVAQVTFGAVSTVNGVWVGLNTCALMNCFSGSNGAGPVVGALLGGGAGAGIAYAYRELAGGWGRAALLDSGTSAAAIGAFWLASRRFWGTNVQIRYLVAAGLDVVGAVGLLALAPHVAPRPEAVWLADSLALWGVVVGNLLTGFLRAPEGDPANIIFGASAAGGLAGAMLAASASRMSAARFWVANGLALLGGLVLGGGLYLAEYLRSGGGFAFQPAVPLAGAAAGIAGGFLVGFVLSESL